MSRVSKQGKVIQKIQNTRTETKLETSQTAHLTDSFSSSCEFSCWLAGWLKPVRYLTKRAKAKAAAATVHGQNKKYIDREYLPPKVMVVCRWRHGSSGNVQNERLSVIDPIPRARERESFASKGGRGGRGTACETSVVLPPFSVISYYYLLLLITRKEPCRLSRRRLFTDSVTV